MQKSLLYMGIGARVTVWKRLLEKQLLNEAVDSLDLQLLLTCIFLQLYSMAAIYNPIA